MSKLNYTPEDVIKEIGYQTGIKVTYQPEPLKIQLYLKI